MKDTRAFRFSSYIDFRQNNACQIINFVIIYVHWISAPRAPREAFHAGECSHEFTLSSLTSCQNWLLILISDQRCKGPSTCLWCRMICQKIISKCIHHYHGQRIHQRTRPPVSRSCNKSINQSMIMNVCELHLVASHLVDHCGSLSEKGIMNVLPAS